MAFGLTDSEKVFHQDYLAEERLNSLVGFLSQTSGGRWPMPVRERMPYSGNETPHSPMLGGW